MNYSGKTFTIQHPQGWTVQENSNGLIATIADDGTSRVLLWPVYIDKILNDADCKSLLKQFAKQQSSGVKWSSPAKNGELLYKMNGDSKDKKISVSLVGAADEKGTSGFLFLAESTADKFLSEEETFAGILSSFRYVKISDKKNTQAQERPRMQYVKFTDPNENAFSLEVPKGWKTTGGLYRASSVDVRLYLKCISPDGEITLFGGDKDIPKFCEPNQTLTWTGFTEGSWYSPGYGTTFMVRRFFTGLQFAAAYALQIAPGSSLTEKKDLPDVSSKLTKLFAASGAGMEQRYYAGEVQLECEDGKKGYVFAATQNLQGYGISQWSVEYLYGYRASASHFKEAQEALGHMVNTFAINPQWFQMQQGITANTSKIVAQTNQEISNIINSTFEATQLSQDKAAERFSEYIRGVEKYKDPQTGSTYELQSGSNYQWIDNFDYTIGTNIYENPDPTRFRELVKSD